MSWRETTRLLLPYVAFYALLIALVAISGCTYTVREGATPETWPVEATETVPECADGSCSKPAAPLAAETQPTPCEAFDFTGWCELETLKIRNDYKIAGTVRTVLKDEAGVSASGLFDVPWKGRPATITIFLRDAAGARLTCRQLRYVWHHEALHWLDDLAGLPPAPPGHDKWFQARMVKMGWWPE